MLSFSDIVQIKSNLEKEFDAKLHYHDVCPKPYFTLDKTNQEIKEYINKYLTERNQSAVFSSDGLHFTIERNH